MKNRFNNDWRMRYAALFDDGHLRSQSFKAEGQSIQDPPFGRPDAVVDLASREGVELVNGQWRYHDVKIVEPIPERSGPI